MIPWEPLAREMREQGKTLAEIGERVGRSQERVRQVLGERPDGTLSDAGWRGAMARWYGDPDFVSRLSDAPISSRS